MLFQLASIIALMFLNVELVATYRPLVIINGVRGHLPALKTLELRVKQDFPDLEVFILDSFHDIEPERSLGEQIIVNSIQVRNITAEHGPITLLGFSDGGLVARGVVERNYYHRVHTLISLSSPRKNRVTTWSLFSYRLSRTPVQIL